MKSIISYENIDLFYYHSIDFDFARFCSILNSGIVSKKAAQDENLKYYYRNYTNASCKNEYVSISHFPQTVFRYYKIENELYDFNTNKICFILDTDDTKVLDKQACKNRYKYTNERHVYYKIEPSDIKGILLRDVDASKKISEISFNYKYTDKLYFENKVFATINFFNDNFASFGYTNKVYYLIGKLREARICNKDEDIIIEMISREIKNNINIVLSKTLGKKEPTLLDAVNYFNNDRYPIYIMNNFDIQLVGEKLVTTDLRLERFKNNCDFTISELKEKEKIDKKTLRLVKKMTDTGVDIYYGYSMGPFIEEDAKIVEDIKKLTLKKTDV